MASPFLLDQVPWTSLAALFSQVQETVQKLSDNEVEITRIDAAREICLAEIENRFDLYRKAFDHIFAERRAVIDGYFTAIDQGRTSGDRDMVVQAMAGLAHLVESSPFRDLDRVRSMLDGNDVIEI